MSHKLFIALFAIDLETSHKITRKSLYLDVLKHTSKYLPKINHRLENNLRRKIIKTLHTKPKSFCYQK